MLDKLWLSIGLIQKQTPVAYGKSMVERIKVKILSTSYLRCNEKYVE